MDEEMRHDLEATLAARRELGPEHDAHLAESFLARIDREIDRRVDQRVAQKTRPRGHGALNPATMGVSIPIIAIAGGIGGLPGLITAFAALVIVFLVAELRR